MQNYLTYNPDNGKLLSVLTEEPPANATYVPIDEDLAQAFRSGEERPLKWTVEYSPIRKAMYPIKKGETDLELSSIKDAIYEIPKIADDDVDLTIKQTKTHWVFSLGNTLRENLKTKRMNVDMVMNFSITKKDNPNILLKRYEIKFKDLIEKSSVKYSFTQDFESNREDVSIYTTRIFKTYYYEQN
jgi:hypothetical protein